MTLTCVAFFVSPAKYWYGAAFAVSDPLPWIPGHYQHVVRCQVQSSKALGCWRSFRGALVYPGWILGAHLDFGWYRVLHVLLVLGMMVVGFH